MLFFLQKIIEEAQAMIEGSVTSREMQIIRNILYIFGDNFIKCKE